MTRLHRLTISLLALVAPLPALAGNNQWTGNGPFATGVNNRVINALIFNANGTIYAGTGAGTVFAYGIAVPGATTGTATSITTGGATLNGTINANDSDATAGFEYGLTTSYGSTATATPATVTGNSNTAVSSDITGLACNTVYHFRVKAVNISGTAYGDDASFSTAACPPAQLAIQGGDNQSTIIGTAFASPLSVLVQDANNLPLPGLTVSFAGPGSGAGINGGTATSNASGIASLTVTANAIPGSYTVTASVNGLTANFNLTNASLAQTITGFAATPAGGRVGDSSTLSVTGSGASGNAVVFGTTTSGTCSVSGNTVTYLAVGTCTLTANQAGNASYGAAPQVSINVAVTAGPLHTVTGVPTLSQWALMLLAGLLAIFGGAQRRRS